MNLTDVEYQIRSKESFRHTCEINKPFGVIDTVLEWCKSELVQTWRWQLVQPSSDIRPGRYVFYFDSDRDYCAFVMKWQD